MAEYIDRNLIKWHGCDFEDDLCKDCSDCSHAECSHSQIMQIPVADVVEQEKIDVALAEARRIRTIVAGSNGRYESGEVLDLVTEIIHLFDEL